MTTGTRNRKVTFDAAERARLAVVCQALGTTFGEFVHTATMHALDELEGDGRYTKRIGDIYAAREVG